MQHIRLVLCDIDGTLTGPRGRGHSEKLLPAMQRLIALGLQIGLVTGRESLTAKAVHRIFDLNGPIVAENGAELIPRPHEDERAILVVGGLTKSQRDAIENRLAEHGLFERVFVDNDKKYLLTLYPKEFPHHNPEDLPLLSQQVIAALQPMAAEIEISYSSAAIDISARGINKGRGIRELCRALHIELSSVAFVGDSPNDRSAFEVVGRGGGWLAMAGDDPAIREELQRFPNVYFASHTASTGAVEFMESLVKHKNLH